MIVKLNIVCAKQLPKSIDKKAANLITRCNNPLHYNTQPCRRLWKCVDDLNANVGALEYSIKRLGEKDDINECDADHAHTEACRVYE